MFRGYGAPRRHNKMARRYGKMKLPAASKACKGGKFKKKGHATFQSCVKALVKGSGAKRGRKATPRMTAAELDALFAEQRRHRSARVSHATNVPSSDLGYERTDGYGRHRRRRY